MEQTKKDIRSLIRKKKKKFSVEQLHYKSGVIFGKITALPQFRVAQTVLLYWSLPDEVYTHNFLNELNARKKVFLPVINGETLYAAEYKGKQSMKARNEFGILEPITQAYSGKIDLVVVPGIAFDKNNNRLGRGKGYYDRYLQNIDTFKIGVCFEFQLFDKLPHDDHDQEMDLVVTENGIVSDL